MQVAFFCPHSDPLARTGEPDAGGQCVYEARVMQALAMQGHRLRAYTRRYGSKPAAEEVGDGATVKRFAMGDEHFLRKEDMGPYLPEFVQQVIDSEAEWLATADLFHGHYWDGGAAALMASLTTGKPLVFTSHSLGILKQDRLPDNETYHYDIRIPAETHCMQAADAIIALSSIEKQALMERYDIDKGKIHIVPGGVEVERFKPTLDKRQHREAIGIDEERMVFTIGRLDARKGFGLWIQAMPIVAEALRQSGQSFCFMMPAGPDKPSDEERRLRDELMRQAERLGVATHIRWFNRLSDEELYHAYCAADLFVCPSLYEPFGLVLVEAMAAATPVVATIHGGPVDIVENGVDGYLADPNDAGAWAAAVLQVLNADDTEREQMGRAAMDKARRRYAWSAVAGAIARIYEGVLEKR